MFLVLQLPLRNLLKPGVKSRMKVWLEQRRQAMLQLHLSDNNFIAYYGASYSAVDKTLPSRQMWPITRLGDPTWPPILPMGDPSLAKWEYD